MNLISPVKNLQQIVISCPQRGLCHGTGQAPWRDSFSVKSKGTIVQESTSFISMFTKYKNLIYRKQFI